MKSIKTKQYAQAIYEIAEENNQVDDYLELSLAIIDIANHNDKLFLYLGHYDVSKEDKKKLIKELCNNMEFYENWLSILVDSGLSKHIRLYINQYVEFYNKKHDIEKGFAWTTEPIEQKIIKTLEKLLSKKLGKSVMLENKINKELIGGIKLEIGDNVWDSTIKNKLVQLLKEGSENNE